MMETAADAAASAATEATNTASATIGTRMDIDTDEGGEGGSRKRSVTLKKQQDDDDDMLQQQDSGGGYRRLNVYGEHKRAVSSVAFAPARICKNSYSSSESHAIQGLVASASASAFVKVWDLKSEYFNETSTATASPQQEGDSDRKSLQHCTLFLGHSRGINDLAWNPVSPLLASASDDKTVRLWDAVTGESLVEFRGHDNFVFCVDQHHALIVSGSFDETVKLWDVRSGDCVSTLPAHSDPVTAVSLNRDGTCVTSASHDGLIRVWDVATGECLKTIFAAGNPPVSSVKYSPNGKYLLAGTLDSTLRLWPVHRTGSHKPAKTYSTLQLPSIKQQQYHVNTKYSIASDFMYDGNIVTGSETGKIVLYDVQTRNVLQVMSSSASGGGSSGDGGDGNNNSSNDNNKDRDHAVLAVSAHDTLPILASGGMTADRKVEFWVKHGNPQEKKKTRNENDDPDKKEMDDEDKEDKNDKEKMDMDADNDNDDTMIQEDISTSRKKPKM